MTMASQKSRRGFIAARHVIPLVAITCLVVLSMRLHMRTGKAVPRNNPAHGAPWAISLPAEQAPNLDINAIVHHGRIIEIKGCITPMATVMINGRTAATMFDNGCFRHFVGPLPAGPTIVTVTAQDDQGGVSTRNLAEIID
jgi:hypothetical protein